MKTSNVPFLILLMVVFFSCKSDPPEPVVVSVPVVDLKDRTGPDKPCESDIIYFKKDIMPLLLSSCAYSGCHDSKTAEDGVILDTYENVIRTGKVVPYKSGDSKLYKSLFESGDDRMPPPPNSPLTQAQKAVIKKWIDQGAENFVCKDSTPPPPPVSEVFTLSGTVQPIMDKYGCNRCHSDSESSSSGRVSLQGYTKLKIAVDNGSFLGTLTATNGFSIMPPSGPIPDAELKKIKQWITNGAAND